MNTTISQPLSCRDLSLWQDTFLRSIFSLEPATRDQAVLVKGYGAGRAEIGHRRADEAKPGHKQEQTPDWKGDRGRDDIIRTPMNK
jgi:hypothetical protein